jgi:hypothetical protein
VHLLIGCSAILAMMESGRLVLTKHSRVSHYCSLHLVMLKKLNTPHLLFSDLGTLFLDQKLRFVYYVAQKPPLAMLAMFKARRMSDCSSCA